MNQFLEINPFPLSLASCEGDVKSVVERTITKFGKIRMAPTIAKRAQAIEMTKACETPYINIKSFHLPYTLKGDELVCGYHGLIYDSYGRCTFMPSQETINPAACVRAFPVEERHRFVWLWPGDPALADPALIPDLHCDYRLVVDNLMDLTHETFVHGSSIGQHAVAEAPFDVTHGDRTATVARWMRNIDPPPFWAGQLGKPGKVDRWQIIRFEAPCTIAIDVGVAPTGTGAPEGDRSQGVNGYVLNSITPETDSTCHYFWAFVRSYRLGDQRLTTELRDGVSRIFREDELILEAQQKAIEEHPDHVFYNLNIDAGAMWARRLIDRMVAAEGATPTGLRAA